MTKDKNFDVFISYSHHDEREFRRRLYEQMRAVDLNVMFDSLEIKIGENWRQVIEAAVDNAAFITTNYDKLFENALSKGTPDLNLPEQVDKAAELALPPQQVEVVDTISNIKDLSVGLIVYLKKHKADLDKLRCLHDGKTEIRLGCCDDRFPIGLHETA